MSTFIKIKVKPSKECCTNPEVLEKGFSILEIRHDLILGYCRDINRIYVSGFGNIDLADCESIDCILKQYEDICSVEDLARYDAAAETMKEGMRRIVKDGSEEPPF